MPQGVGNATINRFGQDVFGGKLFGAVDYKGPASYVQGGDALDPHAFGFPNAIETLTGSVDQSGKFFVIGRPIQNDVTPFQLVWISLTTGSVGGQNQTAGQEAVAGTNLSGFTVRLGAIGV